MRPHQLTLALALGAIAIHRKDHASDRELPGLGLDNHGIEVIHVIDPQDEEKDATTLHGPGGYTDDGETWSCRSDCDIKASDCDAVRTTIEDLGGSNGWWRIPETAGCNSWQQGDCKATFCPLDVEDDEGDNLVRKGMVISTPTLAKQMGMLAKVCAQDGRRGHMQADNGTWRFWLTEAGWQQD